MASDLIDHDRETAGPSRNAKDAWDAALDRMRLSGAIFFRAEFTENWSYASPTSDQLAQILRPQALRLIIFHIVAAGTCWVEAEGGRDRVWASEGDVIVIPYGQQHTMGGTHDAATVPILSLLDPPPWATLPVLHHGEGGEKTEIVCGYLHSEHPLFNPALGALPKVFTVRPPEGPAARWIRSSIEYALAANAANPMSDPGSTRLAELVLTEVLRLHLATAPGIESGGVGTGWLAALGDPVLAPALAHLHAAPERHWTVEALASSVAVSRSLLDDRFRQVLGRSPIRYLTDWRMHLAEDLLRTTRQSIGSVARRVGYDSEEAFSRAFKRAHDVAPGAWRALQLAS